MWRDRSDKPLFVWFCQHCYELHEETIEPTLSPWLTHCPGCTDPATRPVVLLGRALWVGPHLLRGYPDDLDRLLNMLGEWQPIRPEERSAAPWLLSPPTAENRRRNWPSRREAGPLLLPWQRSRFPQQSICYLNSRRFVINSLSRCARSLRTVDVADAPYPDGHIGNRLSREHYRSRGAGQITLGVAAELSPVNCTSR